MKKMLVAAFIMLICTFTLGLSIAYADDTVEGIDVNRYIFTQDGALIKSTGQFYVTLSQPVAESNLVFEDSFLITGSLDNKEIEKIRVELHKKNLETGKYERFFTSDVGDYLWDFEGGFSRLLSLTKGMNYFVLVAYIESKDTVFEVGETLQVSFFNFDCKDKSVRDNCLNKKGLNDIFEDEKYQKILK